MAKYLPDLPSSSQPKKQEGLPAETRRRFALTQELFSRSISVWDELEHTIQCSGHGIDDWIAVLKKNGTMSANAYAGYLSAMKKHIEISKKRKLTERPRQAYLNRIPPSRLIRRV